MYNRIGRKIKILAKTVFVLSIVLVVILTIAFFDDCSIYIKHGNYLPIFYGLLIMLVGSLLSWVSTWLLYGFGELIDKTTDIEEHLHAIRVTGSRTRAYMPTPSAKPINEVFNNEQ